MNREKELDKITTDIKNHIGVNRAFFVSSKSGIGKSSFCSKVCKSQTYLPTVRLSLSPSRLKFQQEGYYLRELCIQLDEASCDNRKIPSFSEFWRTSAPEDIAKEMADFIVKEFSKSNLVTKTIKQFSDSVKERTDFSAKSMFEISSNSIINNAADYIEHVFSNVNLLINIENIQCIDPVSLEKLSAILRNLHGQYLLFEYTENTGNIWSLDELCTELSNAKVLVEKFNLERLSVDDILSLFNTHPEAIIELIKELYIESDGSLTALKHYNLKFNIDDQPIAYLESLNRGKLEQITFDFVNDLTEDEKLTLSLYSMHGDWVSFDLIKPFESYIASTSPLFDIELLTRELARKSLLDIDVKFKRVRCDEKLLNILQLKQYTKYKAIAVNFWIELYNKVLLDPSESLIPKSEVYYFLIYFNLVNNEAEKSLSLIDEISYLALNSYAPSKLIQLLLNIRNKIETSGDIRYLEIVDKRLIDILVSLSYSETALELVECLSESATKYIYKGSIQETCGKAYLAIATSKELKEKFGKDHIKNLAAAELIEFAALRSLGDMKSCKKLFTSMVYNQSYINLFEYGFILRSAASALTAQECIPYVEKSIEFFRKREAFIQEGFSRVELSVAYSVCREYTKALKILDDCSSLLLNRISEKHSIYNNKACIKLFLGQDIKESYLLLKQARQTASLGFDRLAIANNIFITLSLFNPQFVEAAIEQLETLIAAGGFQSKGIIRKVYYNIAVHYYYSSKNKYAEEYLQKMQSIKATPRHKYTKNIDFPYDEYGHSIYNKPFSPVLMAHWNMEFNNFSEQFLRSS